MDLEGIFSAVHGGGMFVLLILLILFNYLSIRGVPCVILDNLYLLTAAGLPLKLHSSFLLTPRILRAASTSHRKDHLACIFPLYHYDDPDLMDSVERLLKRVHAPDRSPKTAGMRCR